MHSWLCTHDQCWAAWASVESSSPQLPQDLRWARVGSFAAISSLSGRVVIAWICRQQVLVELYLVPWLELSWRSSLLVFQHHREDGYGCLSVKLSHLQEYKETYCSFGFSHTSRGYVHLVLVNSIHTYDLHKQLLWHPFWFMISHSFPPGVHRC